MTRTAVTAAVSLVVAGVLTGCGGGAGVAEPTGDELYERAEGLYTDYREATNRVLARIDEGTWRVGDGGYGMTPSGSGCADGWKFDLTRSTTVDPADQPVLRQAAADQLVEEGFNVEGLELASDTVASGDLIVREQGVFSLLTITFVDNGNVLVKATTPCQPGDRAYLRERLLGSGPLEYGYLPTVESPSDPLFFGITPGDPQFAPAP